MKINKLLPALIVVIILIVYACTFIVKEGNVGVLLVLGKPEKTIDKPNLYFKWPWPISEAQIFDTRTHLFAGKEEQIITQDQNTIIIQSHCVWKIKDPVKFLQRANNEDNFKVHLNDLLRGKQNTLFGKENFKDIFSVNNNDEKKLETIENKLTQLLNENTEKQYGVTILTAGFDKIRLPETVMEKVYTKMISDRQQKSEALRAEGEAEANKIKTKAKAKYDQELAKIEGQVKEIIGKAEAESIEAYKVFAKNPELALGLKKIESLNSLLKDRSTVILDPSIAPLDIIHNTGKEKR
jgi:modulator of FtsH protease HflC